MTISTILPKLELNYDKNQLLSLESSVEPNGGVLNLEKALNENPECWDVLSIPPGKPGKKTIILNSGWDRTTDDGYLKYSIVSKLIDDGFKVYYQSAQGIERLDDSRELDDALTKIVSIHSSEESSVLKKLNLTPNQVELFNKKKLDEICSKTLSNPELFFYFINVLTVNEKIYEKLAATEFVDPEYINIIEWSLDNSAINSDKSVDWELKHAQFEKRGLHVAYTNTILPQFLPAVQDVLDSDFDKDEHYLAYLLQNYPDFRKKIRHVNLAHKVLDLISFLNQSENLHSLSLTNCEFLPVEIPTLVSTSLRYLNFDSLHLECDLLSIILNHSPHLDTLCLAGHLANSRSLLNPQEINLRKLRTINLKDAYLTLEQLSIILNATTNLNKLDIHNGIISSGTLDIHTPKNHLREINLASSGFTLQDVNTLINRAPNLELLSLAGIDNNNNSLSVFKITHPLHKLGKIGLSHSSLTVEQLCSLLNAAPNVSELDISRCEFNKDNLLLKPDSLAHLKKLTATGTDLTRSQLKTFLAAAPNLKELSLKKTSDFSEFLDELAPNSLPELTSINFTPDSLDISILTRLMTVAPNLKEISFIQRKNKTGLKEINWFRASFPHIQINTLSVTSLFNLISHLNSEPMNLSLDGNIGKPAKTPDLPARVLFKAKGAKQPELSSYHLDSLSWDSRTQNFNVKTPKNWNLMPVPESLKLTNWELETLFSQLDASSEQAYGQITYTNPEVNKWIQLPALSTKDDLLNYAVDHPNFTLKKDKLSGYYFIKFHEKADSVLVNLLIKPGQDRAEYTNSNVSKMHLDWISELSFTENGNLKDSHEYRCLIKLKETQLIEALAEYCRFKEPYAAEDINGDTIQVLNGLIKKRAGACRHRAQLFVALAEAFKIDACVITNDLHEFARIDKKDTAFIYDLGGAPGNPIKLPMPSIPNRKKLNSNSDPLQEKDAKTLPKGITGKPILPLAANNRFQTWNSYPIHAKSADDLVDVLTAKGSRSRHWLIFKEKQELESLHHASATRKNTFFTRDLDSLRLQNLRVEQGKDVWVDSPVTQFIKEAALNPKESYTWFINWSEPKARHVSLNSIIDDEDRNLGGLAIPPNVHIVAGSDRASAMKMGEDFYSRFDAISQAPELLPVKMPPIKLKQPIEEQDVLFPTSLNWESILIGRHIFDDGVLDIFPGALMKAVQEKTAKLTLHNAPLENPEFRFFLTELTASKRFFFNGEWHVLPEDFHIDFAIPDLSTFPAINQPKSVPNKTLMVNQSTLPLFSKRYKISDQKTIKPLPGFFASYSSLELIVTDNLTEIQWYNLLKEAKEQKCALIIKATPKVFIPEALQDKVTPIAALKPINPLIIASDVDAAADDWKKTDTIIINIDLKTTFNSLFYHVSLKDRQFSGQETALLQAVKKGRPVILKGQFSPTLAQQLQSSSLWVNGEEVPASNLILISDDASPFKAINAISHLYNPEIDFKKVDSTLVYRLKNAYTELKIRPCHSHFFDLPQDLELQTVWVDKLIDKLKWGAGILPDSAEPTTPETVLEYLDQHSIVYLTSKTGSGKSHFVQKTLPAYGKEHNKPITIYHGLPALKDCLHHKGPSLPILFIDEANLSREHYSLFEAIARGDKEFWFDGEPYSGEHKIICAFNPKSYEGRFEPDLFRRFPNYQPFQGQTLEKIIDPLLQHYVNKKELFTLINTYYIKAKEAGLNITQRNAQMMCMRFIILKEFAETKPMQDEFLLRYAILNEIKTLSLDKNLSRALRKEIKQTSNWKEDKYRVKSVLLHSVPKATDSKFIWTSSRQTAAFSIDMLMRIRDKKIKGELAQELGINGLILESDPGLGKSQSIHSALKAKGIEYVLIAQTNPQDMERKLVEAFHKGQVVFIEEFNTLVNEKLLNALLSGTDLEGNPAKVPGFCLLGTQNPHYKLHDRTPLSDALDNRLLLLELSHYTLQELQRILIEKFMFDPSEAVVIGQEYMDAREYAQQLGLFPPPNPRVLMTKAEEYSDKKSKFKEGKSLQSRDFA